MSDSLPALAPRFLAWRVAQWGVGVIGLVLLGLLAFAPRIGLHAFWNVLIPVAPLVLVVAPGVWRNVCPLASAALLPRHLGRSRRLRMSRRTQGRLQLAGVLLLLVIVPLRHVSLDLDATATLVLLLAAGLSAAALGSVFEWKSAWCAGACPVHAVERLYGSSPVVQPQNAHCSSCVICSTPCPDATGGRLKTVPQRDPLRHRTAMLMAGAFPGFIWGWFQVPDYPSGEGWGHLASAFGLPLGAGLVTLLLFGFAHRALPLRRAPALVRVYAAAAVSCYYWYRLPALGGFGPHPGDGMLVDLTAALPAWAPAASRATTTALLAAWLLFGLGRGRAWQWRPAFEQGLPESV